MAHDYLEDYRLYDEEATAGEIRRKAALARLYEKGKAHRILKRMDNPKGFLADLEGEIRKYHTKKNYERALLELLTEGTAYISHGSPSIMQYSYADHGHLVGKGRHERRNGKLFQLGLPGIIRDHTRHDIPPDAGHGKAFLHG